MKAGPIRVQQVIPAFNAIADFSFSPQRDPSSTWVLETEKKPESWHGSKYSGSDTPPIAYHMWEAALPDNLKAGTHTREVQTVDMFGKQDTKATCFRVLPA